MAEAVRYAEGNSIDYTPSGAVVAGQVIDLGDFVGIAEVPIADGEKGALAIEGLFYVLKKTGETWAVGETAYWDDGTNTASNTSSYSEAAMGLIVAIAAETDLGGYVKLTPGVVRS